MSDQKPNVCKQCGCEFNHSPIGVMTSSAWGGNTNGFCSEGCKREYEEEQKRKRLESEQKKGERTLRKWRKQRETLEKRIDRLAEVVDGNDARAIAKARRGHGCLGALWVAFKFICFWIGFAVLIAVLAIATIGVLDGMNRTNILRHKTDPESQVGNREVSTNSLDADLSPISERPKESDDDESNVKDANNNQRGQEE